MQKKYKLIVSDMDGTLARDNGVPSAESVVAIRKYIENGGKFCICTGRMPSGIVWLARKLGLKGAISCGNGAFIADIESGEPIFQTYVPNHSAIEVCRFFEKYNLHIHLYFSYDYYSNMDDVLLKHYANVTRSKALVLKDETASQFLVRTGDSPNKIVVIVDKDKKEQYFEEAKLQCFAGCSITSSGNDLIEVINENCSKGTGLDFLAKYYGVDLQDVIAVGDQINDMPMLTLAGLGIAVANASQGLKDAADMVWEHTNDEDAVKEIIEKYGY